MTPSARDETPYLFILIAIGHALLGAVLSWGGFAIAVLYWVVKERGDLKRGGAWRDGFVDTGFVAVGLLYDGSIWWPVLVFVSAGVAALIREIVN